MPTYEITTPDGKTFEVTTPTPMSTEELYAKLYPDAQRDADLALLKGTPPEEPSLLSKAWDTLKTPLKAGLELAGRPGEFVSGTIAGTLKDGPIAGLKRGAAALTEGNLSDSKIQESTSKILQEQGILNKNPWIQAGVGLAGDIVTDPLNLLGGAGFARKGLIKGAQSLGASDRVAKAAVGVPIGDAFQKKVVPAISRAVHSVGSNTIPYLMNDPELAKIVGKTGQTAADMKYLSAAKRKAMDAEDVGEVGRILRYKMSLPDAARNDVSDIIARPKSAEAIAANAIPEGAVKTAAAWAKSKFAKQWRDDVADGLIPETQPLYYSGPRRVNEESSPLFHGIRADLAKNIDHATRLRPDRIKQFEGWARKFTDSDAYVKWDDLSDAIRTASPDEREGLEMFREMARQTSEDVDGILHPLVDLRTLKFPALPANKGALQLPTVSTQRPNYVPQWIKHEDKIGEVPLGATVNPHLGAKNTRLMGWEQSVREGAVTDIGQLTERRLRDSNRASVNSQLLHGWMDEFGSDTKADGFRQVSETVWKHFPDVDANPTKGIAENKLRAKYSTKFVPNAIADEIEKTGYRLADTKQLEGVFAAGSKLFRTLATSMNIPGHQITNFLGNVLNMYAAGGMTPITITKGIAEATRFAKTGKPLASFVANGVTVTHDDFMKLARQYGTLGAESSFAGEFAKVERQTEWAKTLFGQKGNPLAVFNPHNKVYSAARNINQDFIESPAKLALFRHHMKAGKSAEEAALIVKKTLFDYSELSDLEKNILRPIIPFYTWTRKNVPLQLSVLLKNPVKLQNQKRILDLAWQMAETDDVQDVPKGNLPSYLKSGEVVPVVGQKGQDELPVYARARLPMFDLNLLTTDSKELAKKAAFMLHPAIRVAIEKAMNHRMGDPDFITLGGREVPAGVLGKLLGGAAGAKFDPEKGWRQTARQRHMQEAIPIPLGGLTRTAAGVAGGREETDLSILMEFALRSLGLSPTQLSEEDLARAIGDMTREENEKAQR